MMVKVCGITNSDDALAAAEAGATAVGFVLYPGSPRYVAPDAAAAIIGRLPREVTAVGVFVNGDARTIENSVRALGLHVAQLHGDCGMPEGVRVWKAVRAGGGLDPQSIVPGSEEAILLDGASGNAYGGTGETFDWALARDVRHRVILAGGLHAGNVARAIRTASPWGVDASSGLEARPGVKDHRRVREFVRAAVEAASVLK